MKKNLIRVSFSIVLVMFATTLFAQNVKVIAYRKGSPYGAFATYKVNVDGKEVGTLKGNSAIVTEVGAGQHSIAPKQSRRAMTFNAEAGKTYVVKYRNMLGLFGVRPKLKLVPLEEAKEDSKKVANM